MRLKINEAIARCADNGKRVWKKDIAARLFPEIDERTQQSNFSNLVNGKTMRVKPEWIPILCEMCECSADFLFGISND